MNTRPLTSPTSTARTALWRRARAASSPSRGRARSRAKWLRVPIGRMARGVDRPTRADAAAALVGRSTPLAILPMGTRNHFARDLALPLDGEEAARALRQSAVRAVDVGEVNGRVFINNASMGAYPRLVELRTQDEAHNGASRLAATVRAGWRVMRRPPTLHVRL